MQSERENIKPVHPMVVLWRTIKDMGAHNLFVGYVVFLLLACALLCWIEPDVFPRYGNAFWCLFQTLTTIGFGDITPATPLGRTIVILVGLSSLFIVALITGIVVSFYNEKMRIRRNESFAKFEYNLEHLSELTPEQLLEMEKQYRRFREERK